MFRRPRPAPPEPGQEADLPLYVTAWQDYLTVYRDMSGQSLHRRGYRSVMHRASLNEAAAAGCLLLAGWPEAALTGGSFTCCVLQLAIHIIGKSCDGMHGATDEDLAVHVFGWCIGISLAFPCILKPDAGGQRSCSRACMRSHMVSMCAQEAHHASITVLCMLAGATLADPMCGSGTFLIEAALMATNTAPGLFRKQFPFQGWHDFDPQAYSKVCQQAKQAQRPWEGKLLGSDIHPGALSLASRCSLLRTHSNAPVTAGPPCSVRLRCTDEAGNSQ